MWEFITLLGGATASWPLAARVQQAIPVVGLLNAGSPESIAVYKVAFLQRLKEASFVEGQNLEIDDCFADFRNGRLSALAAEST